MRNKYWTMETCNAEPAAGVNRQRGIALDEIHFRERQLDRMDYLRFKIESRKGESCSQS